MDKKLLIDIIQWDVGTWSKALKYWNDKVNWSEVENCLEVGGREGGLSLWMALKNKTVVCSDLTDTQKNAQLLHQKYGATKVKYQDIDIKNIPYESYFDIIAVKSVLGGILRNNEEEAIRTLAIKELYKALKPGGKLLFAENLVASPLHKFLRKRNNAWSKYWHYFTADEINDLLKMFSSVQFNVTGFLAVLGRNESQRKALTMADNIIFNQIMPDHWKYLIYGVAEK